MYQTRSARTGFLTSGPPLSLSIPASLFPTPILSSPISIHREGRSYTYTPIEIADRFATPDFEQLAQVEGRDGREIAVYFRVEAPAIWFLEWELDTGLLVTHVREEDGGESAAVVVASSLEVVEEPDGLVTLLPERPLARAASRRPGYSETIVFVDDPNTLGRALELRRPGSMQANVTRAEPPHGMRMGTELGVDLITSGFTLEDAESILAAADLEPATRSVDG